MERGELDRCAVRCRRNHLRQRHHLGGTGRLHPRRHRRPVTCRALVDHASGFFFVAQLHQLPFDRILSAAF
jgi:hypothetical protein